MIDKEKDFLRLLPEIHHLAREAGQLIMRYFEQEGESRLKSDKSPVTDADLAANDHIVQGLAKLAPSIPIVSEEGSHELPAGSDYFWLVDPLDGTKSFIKRKPSFTVNIGLIQNRVPLLGAIDVPAQGVSYFGMAGYGAFRQRGTDPTTPINTRKPGSELMVIVSHSHRTPETDRYLATLPPHQTTSSASSVKFCIVAEGSADLYPRIGRTMEWDTAAGHAILLAAGGSMVEEDGAPFLYGKPGFLNSNFVAKGFSLGVQ